MDEKRTDIEVILIYFPNFHAVPNIIRAIKSRRMKLVRHVARKRRWEIHVTFQPENLKGRDHLGNLRIDDKIIKNEGKPILRICEVDLWLSVALCLCQFMQCQDTGRTWDIFLCILGGKMLHSQHFSLPGVRTSRRTSYLSRHGKLRIQISGYSSISVRFIGEFEQQVAGRNNYNVWCCPEMSMKQRRRKQWLHFFL
jgi:hypothetical protein